ncbi:MAG: hypothetical protein H8D23_08380 [Candidatus Brocadiales bacterium]|nr:hypothetical protein [Candidatus Brocadiales bacterium]
MMFSIQRKDIKLEILVRRYLYHSQGLRFHLRRVSKVRSLICKNLPTTLKNYH